MRGLIRLCTLAALVLAGGVVLIRLRYGVSWRESLGIAEQFVEDLLP
jgi:hypothetical protein